MQTRRIDFPDRDIYITADGDWRGFRSTACAKEPETVEWLRRVAPNAVVWDIGASVGPYSLIATALGAQRVIAFEPQGASYGHLCQNIAMNSMCDPIWPLPVALGNAVEMLGMLNFLEQPGAGSHRDVGFQQPVLQFRVDELGYTLGVPQPDHVKIDVDGAEMGIIESGRRTWEHTKSVLIETDSRNADDIAVILTGAGMSPAGKWERSGGMFNYLYEREQ